MQIKNMDIAVAVLQMRNVPEKIDSRFVIDRSNFEILLDDRRYLSQQKPETSGFGKSVPDGSDFGAHRHAAPSGGVQQNRPLNLPSTRITFDKEPCEVAASMTLRLLTWCGTKNAPGRFRRTVPVTLWKSEHGSPGGSTSSSDQSSVGNNNFSSALFCAPIIHKEKHAVNTYKSQSDRYRFHSFEQILQLCQNSSGLIDVETRHLLIRLDEWLHEKCKNSPQFLHRLFLRSTASNRILSCAHNPAHKDEARSCNRVTLTRVNVQVHHEADHDSNEASSSLLLGDQSELEEEARYANKALTRMIELEKCYSFVMNPFFGSGLPYRVGMDLQVLTYFARGRPEPMTNSNSKSSPASSAGGETSDSGSWTDDFPLHKAAYLDNAEQVLQLLKLGHDPNELDKDSWAPIHYAAWYGHLSVLKALINYSNCSVNIRTKRGSTPLHFAASCGHEYVVELLLSDPSISVRERDTDGKIPLELCECVPKPEWQAVAKLLRSAEKQRLPKIQIELMDGSNVMLSLVNDAETTVADLQHQMCMELGLNESCESLFSLWLCSKSLQLQMNEKHKPLTHIQRWKTKTLQQFSDEGVEEDPKLYFRRNARIGLAEEKKIKLNDTALTLLFHEARMNFLQGFYPCDGQDVVILGAVVMQILNGDFDERKDKTYLSNEKSLSQLVPQHKLKDKTVKWIHKIMSAHKQVTDKPQNQKSLPGLQNVFLSLCQSLRVYGSAFFSADLFVTKPDKVSFRVHIGVNDFGLHLIKQDTKVLYQSFPYQNLEMSFGIDKPYIEFKARDARITVFTVKTRQAGLIHTLLSRWMDESNKVAKNASLSSKR